MLAKQKTLYLSFNDFPEMTHLYYWKWDSCIFLQSVCAHYVYSHQKSWGKCVGGFVDRCLAVSEMSWIRFVKDLKIRIRTEQNAFPQYEDGLIWVYLWCRVDFRGDLVAARHRECILKTCLMRAVMWSTFAAQVQRLESAFRGSSSTSAI